MAITIKVQWEDKSPCSNTRVVLWMDGSSRQEKYSDSSGEATFDVASGRGTVYCDNQEVYSGRIDSKFYVTCKGSGLFSYSYS